MRVFGDVCCESCNILKQTFLGRKTDIASFKNSNSHTKTGIPDVNKQLSNENC